MADSLLPEGETSERDNILNKWKDKTPQEVLAAKVESDLYIKTLTARLDDLKKDYLDMKDRQEASNDLRTIIDQMKKERENPYGTDNQPPKVTDQPAIKMEDIETLIQKKAVETFTEREKQRIQESNLREVQSELRKQFGDNYESSYKQRLDQLGLTKEFADDLARNHPTVFIKTFELGVTRPVSDTSPPRNQQRPTSFAPVAQKRDWNYYQEMKKSNPKLYLDRDIAIQMHNDAVELGEAFGMPQE